MTTNPRAIDVARYLLKLAAEEPETELVTHLRLQKLLYYVQGWSLAIRNRPIFDSPIEAWEHGPVVRDIYPQFADHGSAPIPLRNARESNRLAVDDKAFIESIWESYRKYSSSELYRVTHQKPPWKEAWGDRREGDRGHQEITHDSMKRYFRAEYKKMQRPGFELDTLMRAEQQFREGRGIPLQRILAEAGREL